jgi:GT2 family glycosyltransferase
MDAMPRVSIIILNWNGWKDTIECLESVYQITYPNYDVIVVDNGSENESVEKIKEYAEGRLPVESHFFEYSRENKPIHVIEYSQEEAESGMREDQDMPPNKRLILLRNGRNSGFTEGNNIAMRYALKTLTPDYILLLNNDTVVDKNFVEGLVMVANQSNQTGVVGPVVFHYGQPAQHQESAGRICMWTGRRSFTHSTDPYSTTDFATNVGFVSGELIPILSRS